MTGEMPSYNDIRRRSLAHTSGKMYAREGVSCLLAKNLRELSYVVERDVDEAKGPVVRSWSFDVLNKVVSAPHPDCNDWLLRCVDKAVEGAEVRICSSLDFYGVKPGVLLPHEVYLGLCALLVSHPEALMLLVVAVQQDAQLLCYDLFCGTSAPCVEQVFVLEVFYLNAGNEVRDTAVQHNEFRGAVMGWDGRSLSGGCGIIQRKDICSLHALHGLMNLSAAVAAASEAGKSDGFCRREPGCVEDVAYDANLFIVVGIALHVLVIAFKQGCVNGGEVLDVMVADKSGHDFGHTANECILVEVMHELLMHERWYATLLEHFDPSRPLYGIYVFQEREWPQIEVLHSAYRTRHVSLEQTLQTTSCGDNIQPRQFLMEVAQQGHCLRHFLYFVNKQKHSFSTVGNDMVAQTKILPDGDDVVGLPEDVRIVRQLEVYFNIDIEFKAKFPDEGAFAHLSCSANDKGFVGGFVAPKTHLMDKLSFVHTRRNVDFQRQRYNYILKHNHKHSKKFLKHNQHEVDFALKHNQHGAIFALKHNQQEILLLK